MALIAREEGGAAPSGPDRLLAEAAQVARHADARLSAALHDLFLPDFIRPTDVQRAAMANMLHGLVAEIERDLREAIITRMGDDAPPVLSVFRIPIIRPIFDRAGVLRDRELVALLLSRAEDHRISHAVRRIAQIDPEPVRPLELGVAPELEAALRLAESRRSDSHGEPYLTPRDLPADLLRSVDVSIQTAAPILLQISTINGLSEAKLEERVNDFLDLDLTAAQNAIRPYRLDPAFRHAVADMGRERRAR